MRPLDIFRAHKKGIYNLFETIFDFRDNVTALGRGLRLKFKFKSLTFKV